MDGRQSTSCRRRDVVVVEKGGHRSSLDVVVEVVAVDFNDDVQGRTTATFFYDDDVTPTSSTSTW